MLEQLKKAREHDEGFTLIELLLVIVILGVLAGIVVFSISGINNDSAKSACKSDVKSIEVAAEAYYAQNNSYPATATVATDLVPGFLHSYPNPTKYTIAYALVPAAGGVPEHFTVTGTIGGADCFV